MEKIAQTLWLLANRLLHGTQLAQLVDQTNKSNCINESQLLSGIIIE